MRTDILFGGSGSWTLHDGFGCKINIFINCFYFILCLISATVIRAVVDRTSPPRYPLSLPSSRRHSVSFNLPLRVNCEDVLVVEGNSAAKIHYRMLRVDGDKMMEFYVNCAKNLKMFKLMSMMKGGKWRNSVDDATQDIV